MRRFSLYLALIVAFLGYSAVIYTVGTEAPPSLETFDSEAHRGKQLWNSHNCIACHQLYGLGGFMGPDLTNVISTKGVPYAQTLIQSGTQRMPNFGFSDAEVQALIAFLNYVDSSGTSPPTSFESTWYGTVDSYKKEDIVE